MNVELDIRLVQDHSSVKMRISRAEVATDRNGKEYVSRQLLAHRNLKDTNLGDYPLDMMAPALLKAIAEEITALMPFLR